MYRITITLTHVLTLAPATLRSGHQLCLHSMHLSDYHTAGIHSEHWGLGKVQVQNSPEVDSLDKDRHNFNNNGLFLSARHQPKD